jgi:hypothetical protein
VVEAGIEDEPVVLPISCRPSIAVFGLRNEPEYAEGL